MSDHAFLSADTSEENREIIEIVLTKEPKALRLCQSGKVNVAVRLLQDKAETLPQAECDRYRAAANRLDIYSINGACV